MRRVYLGSTRLFGALMLAIGLVMVASTLARGGGPLALGVILGVMFALLGVGRLLLSRERA